MARALALGLLLGGAALLVACDDDAPPVTVPMEAPPPPDKAPKPLLDPSASAEQVADAGTGRVSLPGGAAPTATSSAKAERSIQGCCAALESAAKSANTDATKRLNEQATRVCYQKANQILQGQITPEQALAQVRSSLIGAAPSACY